jgi:hypothetical protein
MDNQNTVQLELEGITELTDITNTYKVKGQLYTRKQRLSSFLSKYKEGTYKVVTRTGNVTVTNGQVPENTSMKSLVEKAYKIG